MRLTLTTEQAVTVAPLMRPGLTLLGKVEREPFDGRNAGTSGRLVLELSTVPTASLPRLREAIKTATKPTKQRQGTI